MLRVWYGKLILFLIDHGYVRGVENTKTLILKHMRSDFIIAHIYYDDILQKLVEHILKEGEKESIISMSMGEMKSYDVL